MGSAGTLGEVLVYAHFTVAFRSTGFLKNPVVAASFRLRLFLHLLAELVLGALTDLKGVCLKLRESPRSGTANRALRNHNGLFCGKQRLRRRIAQVLEPESAERMGFVPHNWPRGIF